jgi:uncharacterized protein YbbK (DUF523 family)
MIQERLVAILNELFPDTTSIIFVSACLLGINCTYDNTNNKNELIIQIANYRKSLPICPEQLGGLPTPRTPQSIQNGTGKDVLEGKTRVLNKDEIDVTDNFLKGISEIEKFVNLYNVKYAILKEKSPSCGVKQIYNKDNLVDGQGVTSAYLESKGIKVYSEKQIEKLVSNKTISD